MVLRLQLRKCACVLVAEKHAFIRGDVLVLYSGCACSRVGLYTPNSRDVQRAHASMIHW